MSVFVVAQIKITNTESYNKYQSAFMNVFSRFGGKLLAADAMPQVIEGNWDKEKIILMQFPDEAEFKRWAFSPEYQEISKDREAGSEAVVLLVKEIG